MIQSVIFEFAKDYFMYIMSFLVVGTVAAIVYPLVVKKEEPQNKQIVQNRQNKQPSEQNAQIILTPIPKDNIQSGQTRQITEETHQQYNQSVEIENRTPDETVKKTRNFTEKSNQMIHNIFNRNQELLVKISDYYISNLTEHQKIEYYNNIRDEIDGQIESIDILNKYLSYKIKNLTKAEILDLKSNLMTVVNASGSPLSIEEKTFYNTIEETPNLSVSKEVLQSVNINQYTDTNSYYTLFLPSNRAWDKVLTNKRLARMLFHDNNNYKLLDLMKYHIVNDIILPFDFDAVVKRAPTTQGEVLEIRKVNNEMFVNEIKVVSEPLLSKNGIVYIVENVLFIPKLIQNFIMPIEVSDFDKAGSKYNLLKKLEKMASTETTQTYRDKNGILKNRNQNNNQLTQEIINLKYATELLNMKLQNIERTTRTQDIIDLRKYLQDYKIKFEELRGYVPNEVDLNLLTSKYDEKRINQLMNDIKSIKKELEEIKSSESVNNPLYSYRINNANNIKPKNAV